MSTTIDHKVVEMRFDNRQFEQNVSQTMSSIDKLNNSLQFKGSTKGFSEIDDASRRTGKSLDDFEYSSYKTGFQWSDVLRKISSTAEWRIAQGAIDSLERSLKSLADQLLGVTSAKAGFSEYELKMGSIQTIMASTGESLETVNGYLNELNEYSDKTIYSFSDMTQNIGKFTNAGVSLKDSVAAIQGVANVAALSGANSNEASRAMYNFSQALSAGYVKLIDWKSIENANMATVGFKEELIKTALEMGTITKSSDGMYKTLSGKTFSATKNFNEVLQEQWMTSDVLTKTLANYADESTEIGKKATQAATEVKTFTQMMDTLKESAQSGWAQTWEIIFGDFEEGKALWTDISNVVGGFIDSASKARNEMLENWKVMGGRDDLIQSFKNIFEGILSIVKPIKEAFTEIFPPMTSERLFELTEGFKEFTSKLKLSEDASDNLKRVFKGIFAIFDIAINIFSAVGRAIGSLFGATGDLCGGVLGVAAAFGDALVGIRDFIVETDVFYKAFQFVANIIKVVIQVVARIANAVKAAFYSGPLDGFIDALANVGQMLANLFESTGSFGDKVKETFGNIGEVIQNSLIFKLLTSLWNLVKSVASGIVKAFGGAFKGIANAFSEGDLVGAFELINTLLSGGLIVGLGALIKKVSDIIKNFSEKGGVLDSFKEILGSVQDTLSSFTESIKANALKTIATAIVMLVAALLVLTFIDKDKLSTALAAITFMFVELVAAMRILAGSLGNVSDLKGMATAIRSLTSMAFALLLMSFTLKIIGGMDMESITRGIIGIGALLLEMAVVQKIMSTFANADSARSGTKGLVSMAFALLVISLPLYIIGSMDTDTLIKGVQGIIALLGALTVAGVLLGLVGSIRGKMKTGASAMVVMAAALMLVVPTVQKLGEMKSHKLLQGIEGFIAILGSLTIAGMALGLVGSISGKMSTGAVALGILAASLNLVVPIIQKLGAMNTSELLRGVLGLSGILAALAVAGALLGVVGSIRGKMAMGAVSVAIIAAALMLVVPTVQKLGTMKSDEMLRGLQGVIGILGALTAAGVLLGLVGAIRGKLITGAASITVLAASLMLVIPTFKVIAGMDHESMMRGVNGIIAILGALVIAATIMGTAAGLGAKMLQGAATIVIMAAALMLIVPALAMLSAMAIPVVIGLAMLAGIFVVLGAAALLLAPLSPVLMTLAKSLALMGTAVLLASAGFLIFGVALSAISAGLIAFAGAMIVVSQALPIIVNGIISVVAAIFTGIVKGIGEGIVALCEVLIEALPLISETLIVLITELCRVIVECAPVIVDTILTLIVELLQSLAEFTPMIVGALFDLIVGIMKALAEKIPDICQVVVDIIFALIQGVIEALGGMDTGPLLEALFNIGIITAIVAALAAISALTPAAMLGVLGLAAVVTELGIVLAAFGALAQIPGISDWLSDGGNLLQVIGTGIGQFIGGLAGGVAQGFSASMTEIATNLSNFMTELQPFIAAVSELDQSMLDGTILLAETMLVITGAGLISAIAGFVTGGANIAVFSANLVLLGLGLAGFSAATANIDTNALDAAITAVDALVGISNNVPNSGGIVSWITGDNSIAKFGGELVALGVGLAGFSAVTSGINAETVGVAVDAASKLAVMASTIPNSSGIVSWFAGDNSVGAFGAELIALGVGLAGFSAVTANINAETVGVAVDAASKLAIMASTIPNSGGVAAWFAGDNSVSKFGGELVALGVGLAAFSLAVNTVNPEKVGVAVDAAGKIAEMANTIPNSGGIAAWFAGDNSVAAFGDQLPKLGAGLRGFSEEVDGISVENVTAAAGAAKSLAEMANHIPAGGGFFSLFTGSIDYDGFSAALPKLGTGIYGFYDKVKDIKNIDGVNAAASSLSSLSEVTKSIPDSGGFFGWFTGGKDYDGFKKGLIKLGEGVKGFSEEVDGIKAENVNAGANAVKSLGEIAGTVPDTKNLEKFGKGISDFGSKAKSYFDSISKVSKDSISASNGVVEAVKKLDGLQSGNISNAAKAISEATDAFKALSKVPKNVASEFKSQLTELGKASSKEVLDGFEDLDKKLKTAGENGIKAFIDGFKSDLKTLSSTAESAATDSADAIEGAVDEFTSAGKYLVEGFANGISANSYKAAAKAAAMAAAAAEAAKKELDEHSPSRVGYQIGDYFGIAFVNAIGDNVSAAYDASSDMAGSAKSGLSDAIAKIGKAIDGDLDVQPTIRPVLDLSDVRSGADSIASMFGFGSSIGVLSNVGAINSMMNKRIQNGANDDVVTAIDKLHEDMKNMEHATYNINGITYGEDSEVASAIETLVRAVKIGGRT